MPTRRQMMIGAAAASVVPTAFIPGVTPAQTLHSLGAQGLYVNCNEGIPWNWVLYDYKITLDGVEYDNVCEIHVGHWAVVHVGQGHDELVRGDWEMNRWLKS